MRVEVERYSQPIDRGKALRDALLRSRAGDAVYAAPGVYHVGAVYLKVPDGVCLFSDNADQCIIQSTALIQTGADPVACEIELGNLSTVQDVTLQSVVSATEQSTVVGFSRPQATPRKATLRRVTVIGRTWGIYDWINQGNTLEIIECKVTAAYVPIAIGGSSGASAAFFDIWRTRTFTNPALSSYQGAVTNPIFGGSMAYIARGGRMRLWDCHADIIVNPRLPRACGITDWYEEGSVHSRIEAYGFHSRIVGAVPGGFDVDVRLGELRLGPGCTGSDPTNGKITVCPASKPPIVWG